MTAYLISCEQATCAVPEAYREIFRGAEEEVESVDGWEPGALNLAQAFAMRFRTPLLHGDVTRLLIDIEQDGDQRWSRYSIKLAEATRLRIAERHEQPYRAQLGQRIAEDLRRHAAVLHVMVHTTATTDGTVTLETPPGAALAEKTAAAFDALAVAAPQLPASGLSPEEVDHLLRATYGWVWRGMLGGQLAILALGAYAVTRPAARAFLDAAQAERARAGGG